MRIRLSSAHGRPDAAPLARGGGTRPPVPPPPGAAGWCGRPPTPAPSCSTCPRTCARRSTTDAGQFCTFRVHLDGETHLRCYSMSSTPGIDAELQVTVKRVPDGVVSNWMNDRLAEGDEIEATLPDRGLLPRPGRRRAGDLRRRQRDHAGDLAGEGGPGHDQTPGPPPLRQPGPGAARSSPTSCDALAARAPRPSRASSTTSTPSRASSTPAWSRRSPRWATTPTSTSAARPRSWTSSRTLSSARASTPGRIQVERFNTPPVDEPEPAADPDGAATQVTIEIGGRTETTRAPPRHHHPADRPPARPDRPVLL